VQRGPRGHSRTSWIDASGVGASRVGVDQVPEPPDVLEIEVTRVVEVHVRLRYAVDQQHPRMAPVGIAQQLGQALAGLDPVAGILAVERALGRLPPSGHGCHYRRSCRGRGEPPTR
jgi:hypothetical protein